MKICLIIDDLTIRGGTHKQLLRLCEDLDNKNIGFEIITKHFDLNQTYPGFKKYKIKSLYDTVPIKSTLWHRLISDIKITKFISKDSNIINYHDGHLSIPLIFFKLIHKKVLIWQMNDLPYFYLEGRENNLERDSWKKFIKRFVFKFIVRNINEITVNVTKNAARVNKYMKRNAKVFYCGVDELSKKFIRHFSISDKKKINLLSTGVFFPYRNYETLIEIVRLLNKNDFDVNLNIIGSIKLSPDYFLKIKNLISYYNLDDRIHIHGQLDEQEFIELYNKSDIFLFLNKDQSWGLAVFEAMSIGLPTIVSNTVGAIELLTNKVNAIIINPLSIEDTCNEIVTLIKDEKLYKYYSINGMKMTKNLSWSNTYCKNMIELFKKYTYAKESL